MANVILGAFTKLGQDALATYASNVIKLMTDDSRFTSLANNVAALKLSSDAYNGALANNVNGGRLATMEKNKTKKDLTKQLSNAAILVDLLANGDESIIMAAGFGVRAPSVSFDTLAAPDVVKLTNETTPGLVTIQLSKVAGANNYCIVKRFKTATDDLPWQNGEYSSALKIQLSDLESGKIYQFQFRALGNKGLVSPYSAVSEVFVS